MAKILAVDDEPTITRLIQTALSSQGHTVTIATSGEDALDSVRSELPDLILLDIMMPGMDGREVHRRLREDPRTADIPVAFLSAVGDVSEQLDSLEEGAVAYITKPFAPSELRQQVTELLDPQMTSAREKGVDRKKSRLRTYKEIMRRKAEDG